MVDVGLIKVFATVAQLQSFSKAAALLGVTQSAVSQSVAQLEKFYGVRLFDRSVPKKVNLTSQGEVLLAYSRGILSEGERLDFIFTHFESLRQQEELKLAISASLVNRWAGRILSALYSVNPLLHVIVCTLVEDVEADFYVREEGYEASDAFRGHPLCQYLMNFMAEEKKNLQY